MDECLILREQWCALVRAIPAFRSFLLLFHSSMTPQFQLTTPQPSVILPRAVGTLTRSPRFLLLLILTPNPLMSRAAFLPCLLDTNKSLCWSRGMAFTHHKLCGSVLLLPLLSAVLTQILVDEYFHNPSTPHPVILQTLPPFCQRLVIFQHTLGFKLSTTLGPG